MPRAVVSRGWRENRGGTADAVTIGMQNVQLVNAATSLPEGTYAGMWSAYTITIIGHPGIDLTTEDGISSIDGQPVTVVVTNGTATVTVTTTEAE